ncbi:MAG: hypothetical protein A2898_00820 [Candidatus Kerfeldbacteria bacterium RIFCSPLOWO2_01_FULL_48_11]|uniref:Histidine kinase N-terminal 7TM region domain-containing protein n=1 Tax=Candidatus Kerfeldbacteria bacterium RIFCSPLOWO2_01_FULL_48_11 TaxID=1798543 RepID=A0A1G2B7C5_9BACT|nr:MAG: hypothetical protein UY52_C0044G0013 [Parcubacteria group bacterium GW2011_GWC2_49_9]OGY84519.1 MAG: hypothetical protein A2898_00820 [Candidatus Kerfeldbacteria bacterium RIFCSPLOWO2_01_FULL_48_11]
MQVFLLIAILFNLILGVSIFLRARNEIQLKFSYLVFLIIVWVGINFILYWYPSYPYVNISYTVGAILIWMIFYWLSLFSRVYVKPWIHVLAIFGTIISISVSLIPVRFLGVVVSPSALGAQIERGDLYIVYSLVSIAIFLGGLYFLTRGFMGSKGIERLQYRYVLLGFSIPIFIVTLFDFILPFYGYLWVVNLDSMTSLVFAGFIGYAITRYRFFDIAVVVRRGVIKFVTFVIVFGSYIYLVILIQKLLSRSDQKFENMSLIIAVLLVAVTAEPFRKWVYKIMDRMFLQREHQRDEALMRLDMLARSSAHMAEILDKTRNELAQLLPDYQVVLITKLHTGDTFQDSTGGIVLPGNSPVSAFFSDYQRALIIDEIPHRLGMYSEARVRLLEASRKYFSQNHIKAVIPFGTEERIVAMILIRSTSLMKVLFIDQIDVLKKIHSICNTALINAELYHQALERAVRNAL